MAIPNWNPAKVKLVLQCLAGIIVLLLGAGIYAGFKANKYHKEADDQAKIAAHYQAKAEEKAAEGVKRKNEADALGKKNADQEVLIAELRRRLPKPPAPAPRPPADAPSLAAELAQAGLPGVSVAAPGPSNLTIPEAQLVISFRNEAIRVSQLELAVIARDTMALETDKLVMGQKLQISKLEETIAAKDAAYDFKSKETSARVTETGLLRKEIKSLRFSSNMKIYIGIPLAALAGYELGRRLERR